MRRREYEFVTVWNVAAPVEDCWEFLTSPDQTWTNWWPSLREIDVSRTPDFVGSTAACVWRSPVGHRLRFVLTMTDAVAEQRIVMTSDGDLAGRAVVDFAPDGCECVLTVTWTITTTRRWMNVTAPLLRPLFTWGHHVIMRRGERGLNGVLSPRSG